jgi:hypothetical protein
MELWLSDLSEVVHHSSPDLNQKLCFGSVQYKFCTFLPHRLLIFLSTSKDTVLKQYQNLLRNRVLYQHITDHLPNTLHLPSNMRPNRRVDMSHTLCRTSNNTTMRRTRNYGADFTEAADEGLSKEVEARQILRAPQPHNTQRSASERPEIETEIRKMLTQANKKLREATERRGVRSEIQAIQSYCTSRGFEAKFEHARDFEDAARRRTVMIMRRLKSICRFKYEQAVKPHRVQSFARRQRERNTRAVVVPERPLQTGTINLVGFGSKYKIGE